MDIEHYKNWLKLGDGLASKQNGKGPSNILTRILIILLVILFVIILIVVAATLLGVKDPSYEKGYVAGAALTSNRDCAIVPLTDSKET